MVLLLFYLSLVQSLLGLLLMYLKIMLGSVMGARETTFLEMSSYASGQSYYHNKTKLRFEMVEVCVENNCKVPKYLVETNTSSCANNVHTSVLTIK